MKPTLADLLYFRVKTTPKWAAGLKEPFNVTIDDCVNKNQPRQRDLCTGNLINLLKARVRNERRKNPSYTFFAALCEYANSPYPCPDKKKRTALCRKWRDRIAGGKEWREDDGHVEAGEDATRPPYDC